MNEEAVATKPRIEIRDKLRYETLKALAIQGKYSFVVSLVNAVIVFIALQPLVGPDTMLLWLAIIGTLTLVRMLMIAGFFRLEETEILTGSWQEAYVFLAYVTAACWGSLPLLIEFGETQWASSFVIFVISGMSAGALVSLYAMLRVVIPYLMITLFPLLVVISSTPAEASLQMAILVSFYLILLVRSAYLLNANTQKTLRLELENEELFDFLVNARHDPEAKNTPIDKEKYWQGYEI